MRSRQAKCVCALLLVCMAVGFAEKQYRSPEEFDLYTRVTKDFAANDFGKALAGLETWKQKFPESDFASNRQQLYVHAYARGGQAAKAIEAAKDVLEGPFDTPDDRLRLLYAVVNAVQQIPSPGIELRSIASDAARQLMGFDKMPAGMTAEDWQKARASLRTAATVALVHTTLTPVREAVAAKDCASAEALGKKAVQEFPDSAQAAWVLASAQLCLVRQDPAKWSSALYLLARAVGVEPTKGLVDPAWQSGTAAPYLEKMYVQFHGQDSEGLGELKELALKEPLPPAGFTIASAAEIDQRRQADLESRNPELALWLRIKAALEGPNGLNYFTSELKGAAVPRLKGTIIQAHPECRPREIMVSLSKSDAPAEVLLKLEAPLPGKAAIGSEIHFQGIPTAFTQDPFLLTMSAEASAVSGMTMSSCVTSPARRKR